MQKYLLSVDNGGTYIKAVLADVKGNQIAVDKCRNEIINQGNGYLEYDQQVLWEKNCQCMKGVISKAGILPEEICCIGFAGQGKGLYMVDSHGQSFRNAITSSDVRADCYCRQWNSDGTARRLFPKLYQQIVSGQTAPILRWLKDYEPENYRRIRWVFSMKDFLCFRLTGNAIAGKGSQSGTCLVNLITQDYDMELLEAFGISEIRDKLPPLVWDTELCGVVSEEAARQCGCMPGTPVSAGMFDVDASALAMGVIDPEDLFMITGTCSINGYISPCAITNETVMFNSLYSLPGMYLIEEGSATSAGILEWVIQAIFDNTTSKDLYEQINNMVESTAPEGSQLFFLPTLNGFKHGGGQGSANSRGAWIGLRLEHSKNDMLRAVFEGVVFVHMIHLEHLLKNRKCPSRIRIAGGAVNSAVWMQMFADAMQLPVEIVKDGEMGSKGVAIASSVAVGIYPDINKAVKEMTRMGQIIYPREAYKEIYQKKYKCFKGIVSDMENIWQKYF